jgi:N-glycosylase/DNA lyase
MTFKYNKINLVPLDAIRTINSGQVFLWENYNNSWYGIDGNYILKLTINDTKLYKYNENRRYHLGLENSDIDYNSFPENENWIYHFFRLCDNQNKINKTLSKDHIIFNIYNKYKGLRLIRQDPFQCIISFVCASNTNIKRIRYMLKNICKKFGKKVTYNGIDFNLFPNVNELAEASIQDLIGCGLGYRAKFVRSISNEIKNNLDLKSLKDMKYLSAKSELTKLFGIGNKIADCILLFSLEKTEAFPIDIWVYRSLCQYYRWMFENTSIRKSKKISEIEYKFVYEKIHEYFGEYAGYVQQYLYYHIRDSNKRKW